MSEIVDNRVLSLLVIMEGKGILPKGHQLRSARQDPQAGLPDPQAGLPDPLAGLPDPLASP